MNLTLDSLANTCGMDSTGSIQLSVSNGLLPYRFLWSNAGLNSQITGLTAGSYIVTVSDAANCSTIDTFDVLNYPSLNLTVDTTVNPGCGTMDGRIEVTVSGGGLPYRYLWSNGATIEDLIGLGTEDIYMLTVTDENDCMAMGMANLDTALFPMLNAYVNTMGVSTTVITEGAVVNLNVGIDQSSSGVSYNWSVISPNASSFGLNTPTNPMTTALPTATGNYELLVIATSLDGCSTTDTVWITVQGDFGGMPNAFSPNGDGINDVFQPIGLAANNILAFNVYNRWGQLIFDNENGLGAWDGRYKGVKQPTEVYIYVLKYQLAGQGEKLLKGECVLIR